MDDLRVIIAWLQTNVLFYCEEAPSSKKSLRLQYSLSKLALIVLRSDAITPQSKVKKFLDLRNIAEREGVTFIHLIPEVKALEELYPYRISVSVREVLRFLGDYHNNYFITVPCSFNDKCRVIEGVIFNADSLYSSQERIASCILYVNSCLDKIKNFNFGYRIISLLRACSRIIDFAKSVYEIYKVDSEDCSTDGLFYDYWPYYTLRDMEETVSSSGPICTQMQAIYQHGVLANKEALLAACAIAPYEIPKPDKFSANCVVEFLYIAKLLVQVENLMISAENSDDDRIDNSKVIDAKDLYARAISCYNSLPPEAKNDADRKKLRAINYRIFSYNNPRHSGYELMLYYKLTCCKQASTPDCQMSGLVNSQSDSQLDSPPVSSVPIVA